MPHEGIGSQGRETNSKYGREKATVVGPGGNSIQEEQSCRQLVNTIPRGFKKNLHLPNKTIGKEEAEFKQAYSDINKRQNKKYAFGERIKS